MYTCCWQSPYACSQDLSVCLSPHPPPPPLKPIFLFWFCFYFSYFFVKYSGYRFLRNGVFSPLVLEGEKGLSAKNLCFSKHTFLLRALISAVLRRRFIVNKLADRRLCDSVRSQRKFITAEMSFLHFMLTVIPGMGPAEM